MAGERLAYFIFGTVCLLSIPELLYIYYKLVLPLFSGSWIKVILAIQLTLIVFLVLYLLLFVGIGALYVSIKGRKEVI